MTCVSYPQTMISHVTNLALFIIPISCTPSITMHGTMVDLVSLCCAALNNGAHFDTLHLQSASSS